MLSHNPTRATDESDKRKKPFCHRISLRLKQHHSQQNRLQCLFLESQTVAEVLLSGESGSGG